MRKLYCVEKNLGFCDLTLFIFDDYCTLLVLRAPFFPFENTVVISREITMSALREWAAALGPEAHAAVAVSWMGKWKTALQMVSVSLLLLSHEAGLPGSGTFLAAAVGVPMLGAAAALTACSLAEYFAGLWKYLLH
jgi:CDP-diacylglycerol---glycerol-3-phosphate 3-phosphatidyltransferase